MKMCLIVLSFFLLVGCDPGPNTGAPARVYVRENGQIVTTYELDHGRRVTRSSTTGRFGTVVTRVYAYNERNELVSVARGTPGARGGDVFFARTDDPDAGHRPSQTVKTFVDARGFIMSANLEYFYTADGMLDGVKQTDADGNIQTKSVVD